MNLNACLARVWNRRGEACGCAFLVGEDRLLTSAIAAGSALDADLSREEPQGEILIDFPGLAARKFIRVEAVAWQQDELQDYAILAPLEVLPRGLIPPPLLPLGIEKTARHPLLAAGFSAGDEQAASLPGRVTNPDPRGQMPFEMAPLAGHGFSGAPLIDGELDAITGLLSAAGSGTPVLIPLERIAAQWPQLLEEVFQAVRRAWPSAGPAPSAGRVPSPLNDPWRRLINKPGWHERLGKKLADTAAYSRAFAELQPLVELAEQIDPASNYEQIRAALQVFNQRRDLAGAVDQLMARYERKTLLSAGQIRGSRYNPSRDEEQQLALDNIRQNLNDLREAARAPEFGRCLFVLGGRWSGKTHFLSVDLPQAASDHSLVLTLRSLPLSGGFEAQVLGNLSAASGIHWPDLETFNHFLNAYSAEFIAGLPARLTIAVDDLGRWEREHPGFIGEMTAAIRSTTQQSQMYWIICCALDDYHLIADQTQEAPAFWREYADTRNPELSCVDHWLVLDDLNHAASIGMKIIEEGIKKRADRDAVTRALSETSVEGKFAALDNPLTALAYLDQSQALGADQAARLSAAALLEGCWHTRHDPSGGNGVQALRLASEMLSQAERQGQGIEAAFNEVAPHLRSAALEYFLLLLDHHQGPAAALDGCDQVLASATLPHTAVWAAGSGASAGVQKGLVKRAQAAACRSMDGQTLISLLHFLKELPADVLPVQERLAVLQPGYAQIRPGGYAAYFYYAVEQMFKQLHSTDELALSLIYLSGCEPTGLAEDLAALSLATLLTFYDERGPDSVFVARWLLDYLAEVVEEYRDREAIPGQEKGWRRTLFREYVLNSFLRWLCRREHLNAYPLLKQVHWYDDRRLRANPVLALQKEREANIAIGALFRYDSKEGFIKFVAELCESPSEHDRRNAFFIIRHSEHITEERPIPMLDERFQPLLEKLFLDPALERVLQSRAYYDLFRHNLRSFKELEKKRLP